MSQSPVPHAPPPAPQGRVPGLGGNHGGKIIGFHAKNIGFPYDFHKFCFSTLDTLDLRPSTLNPRPSTLDPRPGFPKSQNHWNST